MLSLPSSSSFFLRGRPFFSPSPRSLDHSLGSVLLSLHGRARTQFAGSPFYTSWLVNPESRQAFSGGRAFVGQGSLSWALARHVGLSLSLSVYPSLSLSLRRCDGQRCLLKFSRGSVLGHTCMHTHTHTAPISQGQIILRDSSV